MKHFTLIIATIITLLFNFNTSLNAQDIIGCTSDWANNYNPEATIDDGSCCWIPPEFNGNTGANMTVLFTESFMSEFPELNPGAYVVAFGSSSSVMIGSVNVYNASLQSLTLWGADTFTPHPDGAIENEYFWMQLVNGNKVYTIVDIVYESGSNMYQTNSLATVVSGSFNLQCSIEDDASFDSDNPILSETNDSCMSLNDYNSILLDLNPIQKRDFYEGWNMFGFPCQQSRSVSETFAEIESDLYIVKNNEGNFYWPEFDFDGIGELLPLEGYQTKLYNQVIDFSFCLSAINSINFPLVYGCTDCEADNFNPFANNDDQSCEYLGCTDLTADNYDPNANIDDGSCILHQYQIGDYDQGGIVFYVDESGQHGLVVSTEDYGGFLSTHGWGCNNILFGSSSTQFYVGSGNQNTLNILSECSDIESAAAICDSYNINGFDDWYLPSRDELFLIYTNVAQGSFNNNVGGFGISYWSSSAHSFSEAHYFWFANATTSYVTRTAEQSIRPIRSF